jgi:hemoglobin
MQDITTIKDVQLLVNTFYTGIQAHSTLGPIFAKRIENGNWQPHLEKMYRFWGTLLLYTQTYSGSPFDKHIGLGIEADHFKEWLEELFSGVVANTAKERAHNIALTFEYKLESLGENKI